MECKCCERETNGTLTCSHEHGMAWRFLKKYNYTKLEINEIINVNTKLSIKYKHELWKRGSSTEPSCEICGNKLSNKKILSGALTCSKECYAKYKQVNVKHTKCIICNTDNCIKNKCISNIRELNKYTTDVKEYITFLNNKYKFDDEILIKNKLHLNGLKHYPLCKYCGKPHKHIFNTNYKDCCSNKCANVYKNSKISYDDIIKYYLQNGISLNYLQSIDKHKLGSIYSNSKLDIKKCACGSYYFTVISHCKLNKLKNLNNINDYNFNGLQKFIDNDLFDIKEAMKYFNCSESTIRRKLKDEGITNRTKYSIEHDVISELNLQCKSNDRTLIYPKEIDILCSSFGIEYDGLMWHSEGNSKHKMFDGKNMKNRHLIKTNLCEDQGIQLFHIFSNEWLNENKKEIWKSVINSKLNKTTRIYARKCKIKELDTATIKEFENNNHLQGYGVSKIRLGLYYNDELVSSMSFGKSRYNKAIEYELIRFCSKLNTTVVGGASKLLKYFERTYKPKSIISFANRRWSQGNLYEKLGFEFIENTNPNYFYFKGGDDAKLLSRVQFQKHKLKDKLEIFDENLSESKNMYNNGYRKIYDCGNKKYIKYY